LVLQLWASADACAAGADAMGASALYATFTGFVDPSTIVVERFGDAR
jgi:hypothetical protein